MSIEHSPRETHRNPTTDELNSIPVLGEKEVTSKPTPEKKKRKGLMIGLSAGAAGVALAAGGFLGISAANQPPQSEPVPTSPAETPGADTETQNPAPVETNELTVEQLEIPAGLDAETLGKTIVEERFSDWVNAGADDSLMDKAIDAGEGWDTLLPKIADENEQVFAAALFESGWETDANDTHDVNSFRDTNLSILQWYVATAWSGDEKPENIEGFRSWMTVDEVTEISSDGTTRTIDVAYTDHDNSDKNSAPAPQREGGVWTITTTIENGHEKITDLTVR